MAETPSLIQQIKKPVSKIFRRFFVKRRDTSGTFESSWQELSKYVIRWGTFRWSIDTPRYGELQLDNANLRVMNIDGTFNPSDNADSFWNGYQDMQRSLVKIEAGFTHQTQSSSGVWTNTDYPTTKTLWTGIISGNISLDGSAQVNLPLKSVTQIFREFPARDVTFASMGGLTSGAWLGYVRDHTDGAGNFVFRPFIGTGAANDWSLSAEGGVTYEAVSSQGAEILIERSCWNVMQTFARAENKIARINNNGQFIWEAKTVGASVVQEFHGLGSDPLNRTYGVTIKDVHRYGKRQDAFFNRVLVDFTDTASIIVDQSPFTLGSAGPFDLGYRTYCVNLTGWINTDSAQSLATYLLGELSSADEEVEFTATFTPEIDILKRISITYDSSDLVSNRSFWNLNDWASADPTSFTSEGLIWDAERGDAIVLNSTNFMVLSVEHDLDRMESRFIGRQL